MEKDSQYLAFISYSHRDKQFANWLHRALEFYALPSRLVGQDSRLGPIPRRIRPIFRDREELAAAENLGRRLESALENSKALIVLCSPAAVASRWTNEEIATFKRVNPGAPVLAAILDGEPFASTIEGREEEECFPPALRFKLDAEGRLTDQRAEPIAADFREVGDGKRLGKLKLIAGLFGLGLDDLVQRDAARRNKRFAWIAAASALGMVGTTGLSLYAIDQREEAIEQREQADGLIEFMLTDLREKLEPVGRLDVLEAVGDRALDYYAQQKLSDLDADALGRRSRALHLMGEVSMLRGDNKTALEGFRNAAATTEALLERQRDDWQRIYDHAQSVFWVGYLADEQGRQDEALARFVEYRDLTARLVEIKPDDRASQLEASYGPINLGYAYRKQRRYDEALTAFEEAQVRLAAIDPPDRDTLLTMVQTHAHSATIYTSNGQIEKSIEARQRQLEALDHDLLDQSDAAVKEMRGYGEANLFVSHFVRGDLRKADECLARAEAIFADLSTTEPDNQEWRETRANSLVNRGLIELARGERTAARGRANQATAEVQALLQGSADNVSLQKKLLAALMLSALSGSPVNVQEAQKLVQELQHGDGFRDDVQSRHNAATLLMALGDQAGTPAERASLWSKSRTILEQADVTNPFIALPRAALARRSGTTTTNLPPGLDPDSAFGGIFRD
ncbi:MAG: TIR domain-containing protein [Sphingomonas sp.]|nr:TIR domain-containing protein [Sphingomonas sp.]RZV52941.1 MAG: TIR domain-containing protein [Sphingomonadaceae bacterium]